MKNDIKTNKRTLIMKKVTETEHNNGVDNNRDGG